jgi:hypothetical protein
MRHIKTPEQLRSWRAKKEERDEKIAEREMAHEKEMMNWAVEHAKTGPCIVCPDGKAREVPYEKYRGFRVEPKKWARM